MTASASLGDSCAIDIDNCVENGVLSDMAEDIIARMDTYTEYSPSGAGVRILFKASLPAYDKDRYYINNCIISRKESGLVGADQNHKSLVVFEEDRQCSFRFGITCRRTGNTLCKDISAREAGAAIPAAEFGNGLGRITVPPSPVSSLVFSSAAGHGVPRRPFSLSGTVAGHVG